MSAESSETKLVGPGTPHFTVEVESGDVAPWTEVEPGRFMPRRVRGSYQGRALG
ncbi:MAG: hypothetical protein JNM18_13175 [Planctomycetaceae bacterium]|nr:hypothetical protein [Planctomycetaceae bacterium]